MADNERIRGMEPGDKGTGRDDGGLDGERDEWSALDEVTVTAEDWAGERAPGTDEDFERHEGENARHEEDSWDEGDGEGLFDDEPFEGEETFEDEMFEDGIDGLLDEWDVEGELDFEEDGLDEDWLDEDTLDEVFEEAVEVEEAGEDVEESWDDVEAWLTAMKERLSPLCESKAEELILWGYERVEPEVIWELAAEEARKNRTLHLHQLANAILTLKPNRVMDHLMKALYRREPR